MSWKQRNCFGGTWLIKKAACAITLIAWIAGCASDPINPSFPTNLETAKSDLKRIESSPQPLDRPLVVVGGFLDPGIASSWLKSEFSSLTSDRRIVSVELFDCGT